MKQEQRMTFAMRLVVKVQATSLNDVTTLTAHVRRSRHRDLLYSGTLVGFGIKLHQPDLASEVTQQKNNLIARGDGRSPWKSICCLPHWCRIGGRIEDVSLRDSWRLGRPA
jgi:hypothetical protein